MRRFLYWLGFSLFGLVVPLLVINNYFPFVDFFDKPLLYKISISGLLAFLIVFLFFRKGVANWVKSFGQVTLFRGVFMWMTFIFPMAFTTGMMLLMTYFAQLMVPIMTSILASHMVAAVFYVLIEHERVFRFKRWVTK